MSSVWQSSHDRETITADMQERRYPCEDTCHGDM
jgi:hypothetical protein